MVRLAGRRSQAVRRSSKDFGSGRSQSAGSTSSTVSRRSAILRLGLWSPWSHRQTTELVVPTLRASSFCDMPRDRISRHTRGIAAEAAGPILTVRTSPMPHTLLPHGSTVKRLPFGRSAGGGKQSYRLEAMARAKSAKEPTELGSRILEALEAEGRTQTSVERELIALGMLSQGYLSRVIYGRRAGTREDAIRSAWTRHRDLASEMAATDWVLAIDAEARRLDRAGVPRPETVWATQAGIRRASSALAKERLEAARRDAQAFDAEVHAFLMRA